ncbi:flagellar motor switch protein FliM [Thermodesulfobacteriota bacterium]
MADLLTQDEVNALLETVSTSGDVVDTQKTDFEPSMYKKRDPQYDFKRPNRLSKDLLQSLHFLHDRYARNFSLTLSAYLREMAEVNLISIDQLPYSDFLMSLPDTTSINVVELKPKGGKLIMEVNLSLVFPIIEKLLGGVGATMEKIREITEIEQKLIEEFINLAITDLQEAWCTVSPNTEFAIESRETSPRLVQIVAPNEIVAALVFEIRMGSVSGMMNFCLPAHLLEPLRHQFEVEKSTYVRDDGKTEEMERRILNVIMSTETKLEAFLGNIKVNIRDILQLREGDIIPLDVKVDDYVSVKVGGREKYKGLYGMMDDKKAVKIEEADKI